MRAILLIGCAALTLTACGGDADTEANETNLAVDNMMVDQNMPVDANMDMNAMNAAEHENMVVNDLTNNDVDANLANGL